MIDKRDVQSFFDRLAPGWDAELVRNEPVIAAILDNSQRTAGRPCAGRGLRHRSAVPRLHGAAGGACDGHRPVAGDGGTGGEKAVGTCIEVICGDVETDVQVQESAPLRRGDGLQRLSPLPRPGGSDPAAIRAAAPDGRLSIAHGMSRAALDAHHSGSAHAVSMRLLPEEEVRALMAPYLDVDVVISDDRMYQVCG